MAYCSKCGVRVVDGAKFCQKCGSRTQGNYAYTTQRQQEFAGKVYKCPECGEVLKSFEANCPACGLELRGTKASSAVREFARKLEVIEQRRESKGPRSYRERMHGEEITKTDEQKINLIRSFAIPNTKEDLYEFLILAGSNIDVDLYDGTVLKTDARLAVSDAWKAKFEQAYQKAKLVFIGDARLSEIQSLYDSKYKSISKAKGKNWKTLGITFGLLYGLIIVVVLVCIPMAQHSEEKRLNEIVSNIEDALYEEEYNLALMYADKLVPQSAVNLGDAFEDEWEIQREYWIDKVISMAAENGVELEPPIETEPEVSETGQSTGFVKGFLEGLQSSSDDIQANRDEINDKLEYIGKLWDSIWNKD